MTRHEMSKGDAAWLHMDRRSNLMIVTSVLWFDEALDWDELRRLLQERLVDRYPRFSQRIEHRLGVPSWVDVEDFDLAAHLCHATLPAPGGRAELEQYVSATLHRPLRPDAPLWEMHFVDGFRGTGSALVSRIHHCVADGVALTRLLFSLTDDPDAAASVALRDEHDREHDGLLSTAVHAGTKLAGAVVGDVLHPWRAVHHVGAGVAGATALTELVALPPDRSTALHHKIGVRKQVVWSEPLQLSRVKAAAHAAEVTVNDLVLTAISGALREFLEHEDGVAPDVRAIVPVDLRPPGEPLPKGLGNRFGLVYVPMAVSVDDPLDRLAETHRRTAKLKRSATAPVSFGILDVVGRTPYAVEQLFVSAFAAKGSAVITNVAGPREPVFLAGRRLRGTIGWPPESGNIALGVSIISYDGELVLGVLADQQVIPHPEKLLAAIETHLQELMTAVAIRR